MRAHFATIYGNELKEDMVFISDIRPILFTCTDQSGKHYIVGRCHYNAAILEFLVAETTPEAILDMLTNKIPIRNIFPVGDQKLWRIKINGNKNDPAIEYIPASAIKKTELPTPEMYMETEDDEFVEEIEILRHRICSKK